MTLLAQARRAALHGLDRAGHLLSIGTQADLLDGRLATDMMPFADQIAITGSFARRAVLGLVDPNLSTDLDWQPDSVAPLLTAIRAEIDAATGPVLPAIHHRAGEADLTQSPEDFLHLFALPNMWFHLTAAYAILRANGVALGKADFDGLHRYGPA
ncbi:MAG: DUF1993 family protein [Pseudomonadota bacterium]